MDIWIAIVTAAGTCFATLLVTYVFNYVTNRPKKKREEEAKREEERKKQLEEIEARLTEQIKEVRSERIKERDACCQDHQELVKLIGKMQKNDTAQNAGLQAVLKDLLKIRYIGWIDKGYAPMDARDDLEKMYQAYHGLGANGVMDALREQFLSLPTSKD